MNLDHGKTQKLANYHLLVYMYFRIQVKYTENTACLGNSITVTMTDQCPGCENNDLDLSEKAFDLSQVLDKPRHYVAPEKSKSNIKGKS